MSDQYENAIAVVARFIESLTKGTSLVHTGEFYRRSLAKHVACNVLADLKVAQLCDGTDKLSDPLYIMLSHFVQAKTYEALSGVPYTQTAFGIMAEAVRNIIDLYLKGVSYELD